MLPFFLLTQSAILKKDVRAAIVCQRGGGAIPFIGSVLVFKQEKRRKKEEKRMHGSDNFSDLPFIVVHINLNLYY